MTDSGRPTAAHPEIVRKFHLLGPARAMRAHRLRGCQLFTLDDRQGSTAAHPEIVRKLDSFGPARAMRADRLRDCELFTFDDRQGSSHSRPPGNREKASLVWASARDESRPSSRL